MLSKELKNSHRNPAKDGAKRIAGTESPTLRRLVKVTCIYRIKHVTPGMRTTRYRISNMARYIPDTPF